MLLLKPLRADPPPSAQSLPKQYHVIGKAVIRTSESRNREATLELMHADTDQGFLNIEIFAGLLRCICEICTERLISHLTMGNNEDVSQTWYRDFLRLAGFHHCQCLSSSAGSSIQEHLDENQICLSSISSSSSSSSSSRILDEEEVSTRNVSETFEACIAEGRCRGALLDSVASDKAVKVKRKHSHNSLAALRKGRHPYISARKQTPQRTCSICLSKLSRDALNHIQKDIHGDRKALKRWYKGQL